MSEQQHFVRCRRVTLWAFLALFACAGVVVAGPPSADLGVDKDDGQTTTIAGSDLIYTITLTNDGPSAVTSVTLIDTLPPELTGAVFTPGTGTYDSGTGSWTGLSLAAGGSATLVLEVTLDGSAVGSVTNEACVTPSGGVTDPNSLNDCDTDVDTITDFDELAASDALGGEAFGNSVATDGSVVVVGAPLDGNGSVYVYERLPSGLWDEGRLEASDAASSDQFGTSVAISGDTIVVGSPNDDGDLGSAYVFVRQGAGWMEQDKLIADDGVAGDQFGISVTVAGDTAIVGAHLHDPGGSAYVFERVADSWSQIDELVGAEVTATAQFGISVSLFSDSSGDILVAGAPNDAADFTFTGAAYVFERAPGGSFAQADRLLPSAADILAFFGFAVAAGDHVVAVGAPNDAPAATASGSVFVFRNQAGWSEEDKVDPGFGSDFAIFGTSLAIEGDLLAIGAPMDDSAAGNPGAAYLYRQSGGDWTFDWKFAPPGIAPGDNLGTGVALAGNTLVVGAISDDDGGIDAGSAYVLGFGTITADLSVTKDNGVTEVIAGEDVTSTVTVANGGPDDVASVAVFDLPPVDLLGVSWTCLPDPGASCTASGSGDLVDVVDVPAGTSVVYMIDGQVAESPVESNLVGTASILGPIGLFDANISDNSATDSDPILLQADLGVTKSDGVITTMPGALLTYEIVLTNGGPSTVTSVTLIDTLPPELENVMFIPSAGSYDAVSGLWLGLDLVAGGNATLTVEGTVQAGATGSVVNTVSVSPPAGVIDPNAANDSDSDIDHIDLSGIFADGWESGDTSVWSSSTP